MVTFRNNNNNRRGNFRRNDRTFKSNGDRQKFNTSFSNSDNFKREKLSENKIESKTATLDNMKVSRNESSESDILENSEQSEVNNKEKSQVEAS